MPETQVVAYAPPVIPAPAESLAPESHWIKQLEGERRVATVILADVLNSTNLMERIGTEAWVEIMNRVFQILEAEIYRFGGQVDQFRGDGLVAFFGASMAHEDDPERAILAALFMQKAFKNYAADLAQKGVDLQLRVGVNTGEVIIVGVGDASQHYEDTAMGEAVALAARMESAAEPGTVLVSENTYRLADAEFKWLPLGEINVKGISQPICVFRPLDPEPEAEWAHDLRAYGTLATLIGRQDKLDALIRSFENLHGGSGGIVLVSGEKGMGKSFLLTQVRHHFARQEALLAEAHAGDKTASQSDQPSLPHASIMLLLGICRSYDQSWPYSVWLDLLHRWLGFRPAEAGEETRDRLRHQCESLWGDRMERYYPYLATLLSLPLEDNYADRVRYLDAQGLQRQIFLAVRGWVEALANRGPLVLTFVDLHWADVTSLDLLEYCLSLSDSASLLWLLISRPDRATPVWEFCHYLETEYPHRLITIQLPPLTAEESHALIEQLLSPKALTEKTAALVISKSEGNPFYIREIIHTLIDNGFLSRDPETGAWYEAGTITSLDLPDSLQSLLLARIDRLLPEERRVLQMASAIGPVFWRNVLQALAGELTHVQNLLTALQRAQLIQERSQVPVLGMEYSFGSNLVRDVAYESLLSAQRTTYHLKVAEYLEQCSGLDGSIRHESLIAYHYRQAGLHDKELLYTHKAAEQAQAVYANAEAYEHYTRALELLEQMEAQLKHEGQRYAIYTERFEVLNRRVQMNYLLGNIQQGDADAYHLLALARKMADDSAWVIDALLIQPEVTNPSTRDQLQAGLLMAEEALSLSRSIGDLHREVHALESIGKLRHIMRDPAWLMVGEQALELARRIGDQNAEVNILIAIGSAFGTDDIERGNAYLSAALAIVKQLNDKLSEMRLLVAIGAQSERSGDYYRLLTHYFQRWLQLSQETGNRLEEGNALMYCGQVQGLYLGDYLTGLELETEACQIWEGTKQMLYPMLRIAQIQTELGQYSEAQATLERARPIGEHNIYDLGRAGIDLVSAILYNNLGDDDHLRLVLILTDRIHQMVSENLISRQYQMAAACEAVSAHLQLANRLADPADQQLHVQQALAASQTALELYQQFGFIQAVECVAEEILFRHNQALAAAGRHAEAADYLDRAYAEMMRKYDLIPIDSNFRLTFLGNIRLHRDIRTKVQIQDKAG